MSYAAAITLPNAKLGDYWPPSTDLNGKILFGPVKFQDQDTLVLSDPTTTLDRVVMTMKSSKVRSTFIIDSENPDTRNAPIDITVATGAWQFEVPHIENFLPVCGDWDVDVAIYHGSSLTPLTIYTSTITVESDV